MAVCLGGYRQDTGAFGAGAAAFAAGECYFPESLKDTALYQPSNRGLEKQLAEKINYLQGLNKQSHATRY